MYEGQQCQCIKDKNVTIMVHSQFTISDTEMKDLQQF